MKKFHLFSILFFSLFSFYSSAQIVSSESTKKEVSSSKTIKTKSTEVYAGSNFSISNRILKINEGLFGKELGERANEQSLNVWSFGLGFRHHFKKPFSLDAGISILQNGESYSFEESDTSFSYQTTYSYIAMPIHFNYTKGERLKIIGGIGLTPQLFTRFKQDQEWKTKTNQEESETISTRTGNYNSFVISGSIQAGVSYYLNQNTSFYCIPEYRMQFNSSYSSNSGYLHYSRVFGINFGLSYLL
jgi:hypothetical protein